MDLKGNSEISEFVDLGLPSGTLWATKNIGADTIQGYGDYLTWDEIDPKLLGGNWQIPTEDDWKELIDECICEWTAVKGVSGYKITGNNNNCIFLPAAGFRFGTDVIYADTDGCYWSRLLSTCGLSFTPSDISTSHFYGGHGRPIRPVLPINHQKV